MPSADEETRIDANVGLQRTCSQPPRFTAHPSLQHLLQHNLPNSTSSGKQAFYSWRTDSAALIAARGLLLPATRHSGASSLCLLLQCGDVELNPGPRTWHHTAGISSSLAVAFTLLLLAPYCGLRPSTSAPHTYQHPSTHICGRSYMQGQAQQPCHVALMGNIVGNITQQSSSSPHRAEHTHLQPELPVGHAGIGSVRDTFPLVGHADVGSGRQPPQICTQIYIPPEHDPYIIYILPGSDAATLITSLESGAAPFYILLASDQASTQIDRALWQRAELLVDTCAVLVGSLMMFASLHLLIPFYNHRTAQPRRTTRLRLRLSMTTVPCVRYIAHTSWMRHSILKHT